MKKFSFNASLSVDENTGDVIAVYLTLRAGQVEHTKEIIDGKAFADYDADGILLGIELLSPCLVAVLDKFTEQEPESVHQFLRKAAPRDLLLTA